MSGASGSTGEAFRVVVAGGGVAALEGAFALRELAGDRVALTIATPSAAFVYRPSAVLRPFQTRAGYRLDLTGIVEDLGAALIPQAVVWVQPDRRRVGLAGGESVSYDALLLAIGARAEAVLPGGTYTPWDWGEGHALRSLLASLGGAGTRRVAFVVPAGLTWPLPLYELALLTSAYIRDRAIDDVSLTLVTPERAPLEVFGREASIAVGALLEQREIALRTGRETSAVEAGVVRTAQGESIEADATVALPVIRARSLPGIPADAAGFIAVDASCRAVGSLDVFAAGDCTNQPIKQGGLAAQQADVAAAGIAALAGAQVPPAQFGPELEALLLTGETPLRLDASGATPIRTAEGDADHPERLEKIFARYLTPYLRSAQARRAVTR